MRKLLRFAAIVAVLLLHPSVSQAIDRAQCKQYGGSSDCWDVLLGPWDHNVCGEVGAFTSYSIAECQAQGGTWGGSQVGCQGLPAPEYRRPISEVDMRPFAEDIFAAFHGPLCEGPVSESFSWGGVYGSVNCGNGNGPGFTFGYESSNSATPFAVTGKRLESGVRNTTDTVLGFKGVRRRPVGCPGAYGKDQSFFFTSGAEPALCNLSFRFPVNPKQPCIGCGSVKVGNPIDPITGVKQQIEVDYAGSGAQPLRFERIYQNRIYVMDGKQWRHNYSARIVDQSYGTRPVAMAIRASGRTFLFALTGAEYLADTDIDDRLTRLTDGGGALTGWQYYNAENDSTETYDAEGKLLSIANRAGLTQTLEYSTAATPPSIAPGPGYLVRVSDAFGRQLSFTHDFFGRLATMQDPAGQSYVYESTTQNHFASVTYPDGKTRSYLYNEPEFLQTNTFDGRLTGLMDENGVRFGSYSYDGFGLARASENALGANAVSLSFGSWPSRVGVTDARGTLRNYDYALINGAYRNTAVIQPAASGTGTVSRTMSYDANGNVSIRRDFNGNRTNYTYDLARNLETSRTEGLTAAGATTPQTRTISTQWDATFRLPTGVAEPLRITTSVYDPDGFSCGARGALCSRSIRATTDTNGSQGFSATPTGTARTWTYTYNANGWVLEVNGPRIDVGDITTYTYHANDDPDPGKRGNLASVTNASGHVTQITAYNAHGQPLTIVDPNGLTTELGYDLRLRLTSRMVGGELTGYEYDGVGQLTKVTLPDGSFLFYTYDVAHRLTDITDALGNKVHYTVDAMGNRTQEQVLDPLGALAQTRSRVYNGLNRLFQEIGAQNQTTQYAYDNQGNVASVTDPLSKVTANAYDALNRLRQVTDPALGVTQYGYNALDALTQVTDPRNLTTSYTVDGLGNLTLQQSPDTGNTANTYDLAGNLLTQTDAKGQSTSYVYDALNRVTLITFHDGSKQAYAYDQGANSLGRLSSITETNPGNQVTSVIAYGYEPHGRVTSETRTVGGIAYVTGYSYDSAGRLSGMSYPSGRTASYAFDALGRVNQVSTTKDSETQLVVQNVIYHPFGSVTGYTFGNGQVYSRGVDQDGRIASYSLGGASYMIGFDAASRITGITQSGNPSNGNAYGYDNLDRLTSAVTPSTAYGYSYDAVGNRRTKTAGANTDTYAYSASSNRLASITPSSGPIRSFSFDANGSTLADGANTYAYDTRGRMVQATNSAGTASYQLNALGQRFRKTVAAGVLGSSDTVFVYDSGGRLIAESGPGGDWKHEYLYLGDVPLALVQYVSPPLAAPPLPLGELYFIHVDHLNTPRLVANQQGLTVWRWDQQEPFGVNVPDENPSGLGSFDLPLRLPGQYFDKESNTHYNLRRDYDPAIGRYIQSDPIGLDSGLNTYAYVASNPLSFIDPTGLAYCEYSVTTGNMVCQPNDPANGWFTGYFSSGNNLVPGCKNDPDCAAIPNVGPIPTGCYIWGGPGKTPERRFLNPVGSNNLGRSALQTHSCAVPFGPSSAKPVCSEGCVTSTPDVIRRLNQLIDAEPRSVLCVTQ